MWPTRRGFGDSGVLGLAPHLGSEHTSNPWRPFIAPPNITQWMLGCHNLFIQQNVWNPTAQPLASLKPNNYDWLWRGVTRSHPQISYKYDPRKQRALILLLSPFLPLTTTNHLFNHLISRCHHGRVDAWNHVNFDGQEDIWDHRLAALTNHPLNKALTRYSGYI